ncbi:hypothetical protein MUN82_14195 [Hymenobacter aerilatus]|uniref:Uncharacterized protein n=1 Tax=Hymenobacter aerilatus TaxID=2932251 RepID=A0A8T9SRW4_9BACT|nr:hypothetical protein [Hymenobacter aerilatus]UOR04091.1 hypothetical protein MUN82_14195 [Hymenobacter aerilatus]
MLLSIRFLVLVLLLGLSGCTSLYFPPPPQVPLLTQQGEFSGGVHTNFGGNTSLQGAYAVTNGLGVMGSASFLHSNKPKKAVNFDFFEAGAGYFTRLPDNRVLEIYGGVGLGSSDRTDRTREGVVEQRQEGNLNKLFLQVNYSAKKHQTLHLFGNHFPLSYGTALRLSHVELSNFKLNGVAAPGEDNIFLEPITFSRVQILGPVQLQVISGGNFGLKHRKYLRAANAVFQLGVVVNLGGQEGRK